MALLAGTYAFTSDDGALLKATYSLAEDLSDDTKEAIKSAYLNGKETFSLTKDTFKSFMNIANKTMDKLVGQKVYYTQKGDLKCINLSLSHSDITYLNSEDIKNFELKTPYTYKGVSLGFKGGYANLLDFVLNDKEVGLYDKPKIGDFVYEYGHNMNVITYANDDFVFAPFLDIDTGKQGFGFFKKETFVGLGQGYRLSTWIVTTKQKEKEKTITAPPIPLVDEKKINDSTSIDINKENGELKNDTGQSVAITQDPEDPNDLFNKIIGYFIMNNDYLKNQFNECTSLLKEKYRNNLDILNALQDLDTEDFRDFKINVGSLYGCKGEDVVIISSKYIKDNIDYIRKATSCFWMFLLFVYVYNQIYFLIRGVYPIQKTERGGD